MPDERTPAERAETERMAGFFEEFATIDHAEAEAWVWDPLRSDSTRHLRWSGEGPWLEVAPDDEPLPPLPDSAYPSDARPVPLRWERPRIVSTRAATAAGTPKPNGWEQ